MGRLREEAACQGSSIQAWLPVVGEQSIYLPCKPIYNRRLAYAHAALEVPEEPHVSEVHGPNIGDVVHQDDLRVEPSVTGIGRPEDLRPCDREPVVVEVD